MTLRPSSLVMPWEVQKALNALPEPKHADLYENAIDYVQDACSEMVETFKRESLTRDEAAQAIENIENCFKGTASLCAQGGVLVQNTVDHLIQELAPKNTFEDSAKDHIGYEALLAFKTRVPELVEKAERSNFLGLIAQEI